MHFVTRRLGLVVAQPRVYWTTPGNTACIVAAIKVAVAQGAHLCVFPELALTGFHRRIREQALPELIGPALQRVRDACREHAVACMLGMPTFAGDGAVLNSYVFIGADGVVGSTMSKNGPTAAELTFFQRGAGRPVFRFAGHACTTVMCREVEDLDEVAAQLQHDPVDVLFWPSLTGQAPGTVLDSEEATEDLGYFRRAGLVAKRLGAYVVQSNWPNALNTPAHTHLGESKVYDAAGEVLLTLPRDEAGVGVFTLGERDFHWTPLPSDTPNIGRGSVPGAAPSTGA